MADGRDGRRVGARGRSSPRHRGGGAPARRGPASVPRRRGWGPPPRSRARRTSGRLGGPRAGAHVMGMVRRAPPWPATAARGRRRWATARDPGHVVADLVVAGPRTGHVTRTGAGRRDDVLGTRGPCPPRAGRGPRPGALRPIVGVDDEEIDGRRYPGRAALPVSNELATLTKPVDIVFTWVEGTDEQWQQEYAALGAAQWGGTRRRRGAGNRPIPFTRRTALLDALGLDVRRLGSPHLPGHQRPRAIVAHGASRPHGRPAHIDLSGRLVAHVQFACHRVPPAPHRRPGRALRVLQRRRLPRPAAGGDQVLHAERTAVRVPERRPGRHGRRPSAWRVQPGDRHRSGERPAAHRSAVRQDDRVQTPPRALRPPSQHPLRARARVPRRARAHRAQPLPRSRRRERGGVTRPALRLRHRAGGGRPDDRGLRAPRERPAARCTSIVCAWAGPTTRSV